MRMPDTLPVESNGRIEIAKGKAWVEANVDRNRRRRREAADPPASPRLARETAEARIAELKAEKLAGQVLDREATLEAVEARGRLERDAWIAWVNRAAPEIARAGNAELAPVWPRSTAWCAINSRRSRGRRSRSCGRDRDGRAATAGGCGPAPGARARAAADRFGMGGRASCPAGFECRAGRLVHRPGPYLREIMDALSVSSPVERVVLMKGAQTGGTEAGLNAIGYWIAHAPGLILTVWPSIEMVRRNSRTRIDPLIDGTAVLRRKVAPSRSKDPGNTVALKEFPGGALVMTGGNSATGLRSTAARYLVLDEVDGFPADADGEGDPVALAVQRTVTFRGRRKIFLISTPTIAGSSRIEKAFLESDQRRYFVPSPPCGTFQVLKRAGVRWPEGEPRAAYYVCEACGGVIEERDKLALLAAGEWRPTAPGDGATVGFHLPALASPFESLGGDRHGLRGLAQGPVPAQDLDQLEARGAVRGSRGGGDRRGGVPRAPRGVGRGGPCRRDCRQRRRGHSRRPNRMGDRRLGRRRGNRGHCTTIGSGAIRGVGRSGSSSTASCCGPSTIRSSGRCPCGRWR